MIEITNHNVIILYHIYDQEDENEKNNCKTKSSHFTKIKEIDETYLKRQPLKGIGHLSLEHLKDTTQNHNKILLLIC